MPDLVPDPRIEAVAKELAESGLDEDRNYWAGRVLIVADAVDPERVDFIPDPRPASRIIQEMLDECDDETSGPYWAALLVAHERVAASEDALVVVLRRLVAAISVEDPDGGWSEELMSAHSAARSVLAAHPEPTDD